jgi:CPA2 family monovalent cation:H+ antiporter-2
MEDLRVHDAVVFLAAAGLVIPFAKRLKISPVLGFMLIGLAVGPYGLARFAEQHIWLRHFLITDVAGVRALAELGVVFLLFMIGLELSIERLWRMRYLVFGLGSTQIIVTGIIIGGIAWAFGNSVEASVILGSCLALSSTAIVVQLLIEHSRFGSTVGHGSFAILLAQDLAVVPILFVVSTFGAHVSDSLVWPISLAFGEALIAVLIIFVIGRLLIRPLFRFVGIADSPELFMAVTLLTIISTAVATYTAGLSAALGAFLAGLLLADTEFRHEIEINIEPFKGLFLGLFFMSVAMGIDLSEILAEPVWIFLSVIGLFVIKSLVTTGLARMFGFSWAQATEMGLLLGQVVGMALSLALLPESTAQFMLIVVGVTMFLTPLIARLAHGIGAKIEAREQSTSTQEKVIPHLANHVIIVGYGRTGQLLAALCDQQQIEYIALDLDATRVADLRAQGAPVYLGDASRIAMLQKMGLSHAAVCTDDPNATEQVLRAARRISSNVPIVARVHDSVHASSLLNQGATEVVPEVLESGLQLGHVMLEEIGLSTTVARDIIDAQRVETMHALHKKSQD